MEKFEMKCRNDIIAVCPQYFGAFDPAQSRIHAQDDQFPYFTSILAYVKRCNFKPADNEDRANVSLGERLALHHCEALAIHVLKSHVELVEAYRWHSDFIQKARNG